MQSVDNATTGHLGETLEMDPISAGVRHTRSMSRARPTSAPNDPVKSNRDKILGIVLLLLVVFLWTSSNFVTSSLFEGGYEKPFFITYLNTSSFALYLLPFFARHWRNRNTLSMNGMERGRPRTAHGYQPLQSAPTEEADDESAEPQDISPEPSSPLTIRETVHLALMFCFLWFVANWSVNASLDYTSVASATILSSMSGFFTLSLGKLFRVEKLTLAKVLAVLISFLGVVLVSLSDSSTKSGPASRPDTSHGQTVEPSRPLLGDFLALLGAMFYAFYVILLKVKIEDESRIDMQLFFGFVGLFNVLTCWPIGLILHFVGVERFQLPSSQDAVLAILVNMAITLTSDYIYVLAMLKTTPVTVTVGLSLTIPLAVIGDLLLGKPASIQILGGAMLVLFSFGAVAVDDYRRNAKSEADLRVET